MNHPQFWLRPAARVRGHRSAAALLLLGSAACVGASPGAPAASSVALGPAASAAPTPPVSAGGGGFAAAPCGDWMRTPAVDPAIAVPAGGWHLLLRTAAAGTQSYACTRSTDGGLAWSFVGPRATLTDCAGRAIGEHSASDAGAAAPQWVLASDGSRVVGRKVASFPGSPGSVPWLLLQAIGASDAGALASVKYVQRLNTVGGAPPPDACRVEGGVEAVPYRADYDFYGAP